jgi:two-component system NtrC family sensor kinase
MSIDRDYLTAVQAYMEDAGEESLSQAYDLGRRALAEGLGLLDVVSLNEETLKALTAPLLAAREANAPGAIADFFREVLSPFEMMIRGYREANRDLQRMNEELEEANRALLEKQAQLVQSAKMASLGELVAGVAHELNNPLAFVRSHLHTARTSLGKVGAEIESIASALAIEQLERARTRLREAELGVERIAELVVKLRTFSRLDEGEQKQVSIQECVESVLMIVKHRYAGRIDVTTHFGHPDRVECFPGLLNQALMNLVSNAIDAIEEQGSISISTGADADGYVILIADTGTGIPEAVRERVLEPFFTTKPVGQGTGLGLSITYSIVKRHRGTLELSPRPGGGTVATVRFPIDPPSAH